MTETHAELSNTIENHLNQCCCNDTAFVPGSKLIQTVRAPFPMAAQSNFGSSTIFLGCIICLFPFAHCAFEL